MKSVHKKILLDKKDKHLLDEHSFSIDSEGYPRAWFREYKRNMRIHQIIFPRKEGYVVDHISRNRLDNRRRNLRYVTPSQNVINSKRRDDNKSGFRGVYWREDIEKWRTRITLRGKILNLGSFDDIEDAAKAYKKAALRYFNKFMGEF